MLEIEHKFLLKKDSAARWKPLAIRQSELYQGYFASNGDGSIRVRIADTQAFLAIKGKASGIARTEFDYPIPLDDAKALLAEFCVGRTIAKTRYFVPAVEAGLTWEIDEYHGALEGNYNAELEVPSEDFPFVRPEWLAQEVTNDHRYTNAALALSQRWPDENPHK
jgi:adenylate cyclase